MTAEKVMEATEVIQTAIDTFAQSEAWEVRLSLTPAQFSGKLIHISAY